jgi:hypothetical protein
VSHDSSGDEALAGAVLPLTSPAARQKGRIGGRGLFLYAKATTPWPWLLSRNTRSADGRTAAVSDCDSAPCLLVRRFPVSTITFCVGTHLASRVAATSITTLSLGQAERSSHRCQRTRCSNSSDPQARTPK